MTKVRSRPATAVPCATRRMLGDGSASAAVRPRRSRRVSSAAASRGRRSRTRGSHRRRPTADGAAEPVLVGLEPMTDAGLHDALAVLELRHEDEQRVEVVRVELVGADRDDAAEQQRPEARRRVTRSSGARPRCGESASTRGCGTPRAPPGSRAPTLQAPLDPVSGPSATWAARPCERRPIGTPGSPR